MNSDRHSETDDILPDDDAALHRTQALLWLADSAPLTAAPADALQRVREKLSLPAARSLPQRRWRVAALSGWGAAAALFAVLLWQRTGPGRVPVPGGETIASGGQKTSPPQAEKSPRSSALPETAGTIEPLTNVEELRRQITELRAALKSPQPDEPGTHRPVIQELRPPGSTAPAAGSDRILELIAGALEADLRRRSPDTSGELIIESGWADWASQMPAATVFRHRQFPKDQWAALGLLAGPAGQFYDPVTGWLWSPDDDSTDYTGFAAPPELDRTAFTSAPALAANTNPPAPPAASGYVVTAPGGQTIVALSNLPPVPNGGTLTIASNGTSWGTSNSVRYGASAAGSELADAGGSYLIPSSAYSSDGSWNFSGLITDSMNLSSGFTLQMNGPDGAVTTLLSTGGPP